MTDEIEKVLIRVKKLLNKAESCKEIGSMAEAEAFAEGAQKLLAKYKLDTSLLTDVELGVKDPMGSLHIDWSQGGVRHRRKRVAWIEWLAGHVARAHFCRILIYKGSSNILLVGRQSDREVAEYVLVKLVHAAEALAQEGYWKARYKAQKEGHWDTNGYKAGFFYGFVNGIKEKYDRLKRSQTENSQAMALVYVRSDAAVVEYMNSSIKTSKASSVKGRGRGSKKGYSDGFEAGLKADTSGNGLKKGSDVAPKQLT